MVKQVFRTSMGECFDTKEEADEAEAADIRFQQWLNRNPSISIRSLFDATLTSNMPAIQNTLRYVFASDYGDQLDPIQERPQTMTKKALVPTGIKPKMKSKTLWLHGVSLSIGLLSIVAGADMIAEQPFWLGVIIAVQGALGIGLRFLTTQPIK